jgi:hypothetical protein
MAVVSSVSLGRFAISRSVCLYFCRIVSTVSDRFKPSETIGAQPQGRAQLFHRLFQYFPPRSCWFFLTRSTSLSVSKSTLWNEQAETKGRQQAPRRDIQGRQPRRSVFDRVFG